MNTVVGPDATRNADAVASLADILRQIESEYHDMPGMCVTTSQAQRLWRLDPARCSDALLILVERGILRRTPQGGYVRAEGVRPTIRSREEIPS